jgi:hypothetical protein
MKARTTLHIALLSVETPRASRSIRPITISHERWKPIRTDQGPLANKAN